MSLLTFLGVFLVIVGAGLIGMSARYFYLGMREIYIAKNYKKSIFKKY